MDPNFQRRVDTCLRAVALAGLAGTLLYIVPRLASYTAGPDGLSVWHLIGAVLGLIVLWLASKG